MPKIGHNATLHGGGFHHLAIRAYDFEKSLAFYIDGLGFKRAYGWGEDARSTGGKDTRAVMLDTGDGNYLELFAGGTRKPDMDAPEGILWHFALRTTNCAVALDRARAAGAVVTVEPKVVPIKGDTPQDFHIAFVKGPDGEVIEFFQNDTL